MQLNIFVLSAYETSHNLSFASIREIIDEYQFVNSKIPCGTPGVLKAYCEAAPSTTTR